MNMTEYLTTEQDKWHRRYNDAEIEIDRLKRENERLELAIHRLIMERDMAIKDMYGVEDSVLYACQECAKRPCGRIRECKGFVWRGVKYR